jgi:hypothetical protein
MNLAPPAESTVARPTTWRTGLSNGDIQILAILL